VTTPFP